MQGIADRLGVSTPVLGLLAIVLVAQIAIDAYALVDLWRRDRVAGGRKWLWLILILIGNFAGPVLYLAIGRDAPPIVVESLPSAEADHLSHVERINRGVDALYGSNP